MTRITDRHFTPQHGRLLLAVVMGERDVGKRIKAAREQKRWTQLDFAMAANVSPSTIQRWEAGKLPPVRELLRVAELLGVDPEQLVEPPQEERPQAELLRQVAAAVQELERAVPLLDGKLDAILDRLDGREAAASGRSARRRT